MVVAAEKPGPGPVRGNASSRPMGLRGLDEWLGLVRRRQVV